MIDSQVVEMAPHQEVMGARHHGGIVRHGKEGKGDRGEMEGLEDLGGLEDREVQAALEDQEVQAAMADHQDHHQDHQQDHHHRPGKVGMMT